MSNYEALIHLGAEVEDLAEGDSLDRALDLFHRVEIVASMVREIKSKCAEQLAKWIEKNGEITMGDVRYYVGTTKSHKPHDLRYALHRTLEAVGGDLDALADALSSDAFKAGHAKKILGEHFDEVFATTEKLDLRTGKPARELKVVNTKFLPAKGRAA
jgi:hypothetical protein